MSLRKLRRWDVADRRSNMLQRRFLRGNRTRYFKIRDIRRLDP